MAKFIVIYYAPLEAMEQMMDITPEQAAEGMKPWLEWKERCGEGLVDMGTPLAPGQVILPTGSEPSKKEVTGYSIIQAQDMEVAKALMKDHPHLKWANGCSIEIYETMPMEMDGQDLTA